MVSEKSTSDTATASSSDSSQEELGDGSSDIIRKNPDLDIAQLRFLLGCVDLDDKKKQEVEQQLFVGIKEHEMAPFYRQMCDELGVAKNEELLKDMENKNQQALKDMEAKIADAIENFGESEIRDAWLKKAEYLCEIGDKEAAVSAFRQTYEKTVGMGNRIDLVFYQIRLGLFFMDNHLISTNVAKAKELMEQGGDWDRKNRLKAYEGLYKLSIRDFKGAADLFLDAVSTFTSTELMSYESLIFYTVVSAVFALERPEVREKVIRGAEVQEQLHGQLELKEFLNTLYDCDYSGFFRCLAWIEEKLKFNRYTAPHYAYYVRGMRVKAYKQLLQSYRSLSLQYMADAFGVSKEFIDKELHSMIASGALHCRIDAVNEIVETNQVDSKNYQYNAVIRDGDIILNRIQKLSRVING